MYSLTFTGNPGYLKPIEIDTYLDGTRETASSNCTAVWSDGMTGEFIDYFATQCERVYVTIKPFAATDDDAAAATPTMFGMLNVYGYLTDLDTTETKLLKKCLGDSDGFTSNNIEVSDWDYGATQFFRDAVDGWLMSGTPHAVKLARTRRPTIWTAESSRSSGGARRTSCSTWRPSSRTPSRAT